MIRAICNGFVGACTLTLAHQILKCFIHDAPRIDNLGMESMEKLSDAVGIELKKDQLLVPTLLGDILGNTWYFSQVGEEAGLKTIMRGLTLGCAAGSGAVILPDSLSGASSHRTARMAVLTVSLYALGGLAAALAAQLTKKKST